MDLVGGGSDDWCVAAGSEGACVDLGTWDRTHAAAGTCTAAKRWWLDKRAILAGTAHLPAASFVGCCCMTSH